MKLSLSNQTTLAVTVAAFFCLPSLSAAADLAVYSDQFRKLATARSETLAIMGGDDGICGGTYRFYDDGTRISITKLGGMGTIGEPKRVGNSDMTWAPLLGGTIGYISGENSFNNNPVLIGNKEKFATFAVGLNSGLKLNLTKELSIGPSLGLIYAHSDSSFKPGTALGTHLKQLYGGQLFDWNIDTFSLVPSLDIQYEKPLNNDLKLALLSRFAWFNTWSIASSSDYLHGSGSSYDWENRVDLDLKLPLKLFGFPLHTGGYVALDVLGDDFRDTVGTNTMYTVGGRLVLGELTGLWKLNWLGLGVSYITAKSFYGYSVGLDARLKF
jgi:hypothetical protein